MGRLQTALRECYGGVNREAQDGRGSEEAWERVEGRRRCLTVDRIKDKVEEEMESDLCILHSLGWIDGERNPSNGTIAADIESLPAQISSSLTASSLTSCASPRVAHWVRKKIKLSCGYSLREQSIVDFNRLGMEVALVKCFKESFYSSCR